jgi:hypothetical protein
MLRQKVRIISYLILLAVALIANILVQRAQASLSSAEHSLATSSHDLEYYVLTVDKIQALQTKLSQFADAGIPIIDAQNAIVTMRNYLAFSRFAEAQILADNTMATLESQLEQKESERVIADAARIAEAQKAAEAEAKKGNVSGVIRSSTALLTNATVTIQVGSQPVSSVTTGSDGVYSFHIDGGMYLLSVQLSGYVGQQRDGIVVSPRDTTLSDFTLEKVVVVKKTPKPKPTPTTAPTTTSSSSSSTAYSTYESKSISTERGVFSIKVLTVDFSSGHVKAVTDTAADGDCTNNCPVKALKDYVTAFGGFAGIHGTYFCPTAYADCAGKTNSFYWKIFNPRLGAMINKDNTLGEQDPFLTFDNNNKPHFYNVWTSHSSSDGLTAGISCRPLLVSGSSNVLKDSDLDDKQRTAKTARAALGLTGNTLYAVVASGATVTDLAAIMTTLGVESSLNLDGGGSTALYYNGAYKAGPGRSLPNALIFVEVP